MKPLDILATYFPTGTAEGERHILQRAFVQADEYADLITPPPHSPRVLVGKKGSGKSALIEFSMTMLAKAGVPSLLLKPMDVEQGNFGDDASVGQLTRLAFKSLLSAVAARLGSSQTGLVIGQDKKLYEEAKRAGEIGPDKIEEMAAFLPKIAKIFGAVDLSELLPTSSTATVRELERALESNLSQSQRGIYLFIDDTSVGVAS